MQPTGDDALASLIAQRLGAPVRAVRSVHGGSVSRALRVELASGSALFVKTQAGASHALFEAEATGLRWLAEANALRVPEVVLVGQAARDEPPCLVLEWIDSASKSRDHDEQLGRGLAKLHACSPERFGLAQDNWLAGIPQDNRAREDWPSFYREQRLQPLLEAIAARGLAGKPMQHGFEQVFARMSELCGPSEPPARLHGDLWAGNAITDARGQPVVIDPAVYGGHREIDLAMMKLFGGFSARAFDAYDEAFPLADGHEERVALYQLYPLLVHVRLFGRSYVSQLEHTLAQVV